MATRLEESLERDIDRIRHEVREMSGPAERALRDCVPALQGGNRQQAYAVILRDQYIDEKEKAIDRLCLEFLVRQQPVGVHLRLAYSTIKVNLELERVGDYAESVARHILRLSSFPAPPDRIRQRIVEMADLAIPMLHDSVEAFIRQDPELAKKVIVSEPAVDALLGKLNTELIEAMREASILPEMMEPLVTIGRRFERVPTRPATCAWRRSTCARASTPSTPGRRPSASSSWASTTPAAARWRRRSPSRSASRSSSHGMGGAFIALADDATAASWNPAGLSQLSRPEVSVVYEDFSGTYDSTQLIVEDYTDFDPLPFLITSQRDNPGDFDDGNITFASATYPFQVKQGALVAQVSYRRMVSFPDLER